ncbi:hypothetical protein K443DRAFT_14967 [Laccaria amethystina LaAM-08-1]|uniref:Uncharacterized protein n=1 Tax=Laccaria amethystina LaAM-08-1 TaxID=1095629 RepID=A0A0C9WM04_9AGAR|nr:hypothetical protein K443DRAFT_14967 [Laccaria amethystina LaAM-08-1]
MQLPVPLRHLYCFATTSTLSVLSAFLSPDPTHVMLSVVLRLYGPRPLGC